MKTAKQLELLLMVKELEIQQLKKRIQELENTEIHIIYGEKGTGKRYYERNKDKIKKHKRTRSDRWNSQGC